MKPLRIMHVTNNYIPYQGGIVSSLIAHQDALEAAGHHVQLITLDFIKNSPLQKNVIRLPAWARFTYYGNPMAVPWRPFYNLSNFIKEYQPDIIHVHHPFLLGATALKAAKKAQIPVIFTFHTRYQDYLHYIPLPRSLTKPLCLSLVADFCQSVNGIIAPSEAIKELLESAKINPLITCIPSPVSSFFLQKKMRTMPLKNPIKLLTVSRLVPEKNINFLIELMTQLPKDRYHLTIIGYGWQEETLRSYAYSTHKLSPHHVCFKKVYTKTSLKEAYHAADLFIFASQSETQGLVLAEALASSCPVIALEADALKDTIKNGVNGFLVKNQQEMIAIIKRIAHNQSLQNDLKEGAWRSSFIYSPNAIIERVIDFYHAVLDAS